MSPVRVQRNAQGTIQLEVRAEGIAANIGVTDRAAEQLCEDLRRCLAGETTQPVEGPNVLRMKKKNER